MNAAGIIFADEFDADIGELTEKRTLSAIPFGARYRVIDFTLSNMTNAGIRNIGIVTTQKYQSMVSHIGSGAEWDLDRKMSALRILSPFSSESAGRIYANRLEALQMNLSFLRGCSEKYVLIAGSQCVGNMDFKKMLEAHIASRARITAMYAGKPQNKAPSVPATRCIMDASGKIRDIAVTVKDIEDSVTGLNIYLMERRDIIELVEGSIEEGRENFRTDILLPLAATGEIMGFCADGNILFLDSVEAYLKSSLALLDSDLRRELFHQDNRPIITHIKDSAPGYYGPDAKVSNSMIAAGTVIEGEVKSSIIFRGVRIKRGARVENSVIMQDTVVGENAGINYAVLDKNVTISDGRILSGYITHPFIVKGRAVI